MKTEQKIEDYVPVLYNITFDADNDVCESYTCSKGKCICMDTEQAGLLRKILSEDDQIAMDIDQGRFVNLQYKLISGMECNSAVDMQGKKLIFRKNRNMQDHVKELLDLFAKFGNNIVAEVWKTVPVVYTVNAFEEIKDRNTLIYLCVYASCPERYLYILFRAAICRTVGCCQKAQDDLEKQQYAKKLANLFWKLNTLFTERNQVERFVNSVREYALTCYNQKQPIAQFRNAYNLLNDYGDALEKGDQKIISYYELVKCGKLYGVLKKILETSNVSTADFPELNFIKESKNETEYDVVIRILDHAQHNQEKLLRVLSELSNIFWKDVDVSSEALEKMQEIVRAS